MASDAFRRELHREAQQWHQAGLISPEQFQQLAQQYDFEGLETAARDRFVMILLGLGSLLVGIGAITFVAANWQALSQTVKSGLLLIAMLVADLSGYALVRHLSPHHRWRRLGQALLLLGALLLGANLALAGQMVHTSSTRYELCFAWAMGVLALAYSVRLAFLGMLALLILGIGYWSSLWDLLWLHNTLIGIWTLQLMPLLLVGLFLPLAYRCRSPLLFVLSAIAVTSALAVLIVDIGRALPPLLEALALVLPFAWLWAYDDQLWSGIRHWLQQRWWHPDAALPPSASEDLRFQPPARRLMVFALGLFYWLLSFQGIWLATTRQGLLDTSLRWSSSWLMVLTLLIFALWTILAWGRLGWRPGRGWRLDSLSATLLVFLVVTAGLLFWAFTAGPIPVLATTLLNCLLVLICLGMMREGLASGQRLPFWWGLTLLTLQILSRVLEYNTGLLVKSFVFILCGAGFIVVGLWFERHVRTLPVDSA